MEKKYENPNYPIWMEFAKKELGQKEIKGEIHNPRIVEYHKSTTLPDDLHTDETPYCSSFINFVFDQVKMKKTGNAMARSWLKWGYRIDFPKYGCVAVFKRGLPHQGHVGFYVGETKSHYKILGANQSDAVNISLFEKNKLIEFRWPDDYDATKFYKYEHTLTETEKEFLINLIDLYCFYKSKKDIDPLKVINKIKML